MDKSYDNHARSGSTAVFRAILRSLDTRTARTALRFFESGNHAELVNLEINPAAYSSPDLFRRDYLAVSLLEKYPKLDLPVNREAVAMEKFLAAEEQCRETNHRLRSWRTCQKTTDISGVSLLEAVRYKIQTLLGDFSWDEIVPLMGFSSGASTSHRRIEGDPYYKFRDKPDVTARARFLAEHLVKWNHLWAEHMTEAFGEPMDWFNIREHSKITTVPKNAKTDRTIAIEPDMNMYIQKGIGRCLRQRLRKVGINLNSQTRNQQLAKAGSADDTLSTIDLSAASDTVAYELVRWLMPPDWFDALVLARTEAGLVHESEIRFEKFSSMGNGFTFELESLIFWALSKTVVDWVIGTHTVSVYGDDIIVPKAAAGWLLELLEYAGFTPNVQKTFINGPFRESCGEHYFSGQRVTPFYVRKEIKTLHQKYWLANSIRRWAGNGEPVADPRYKKPWLAAVALIPTYRRYRIPEGYGDGGLISTLSEAKPSFHNGTYVCLSLIEIVGAVEYYEDIAAYTKWFAIKNGGIGSSTKLTEKLSRFKVFASDLGLVPEAPDVQTLIASEIRIQRHKVRKFKIQQGFAVWYDAPAWCI